ncbi:hypothetical protein D3C78_1321520 [compost metagenome]
MANMKPRAELAQSAPMASTLAMSKALTILPLAPRRILSRRLRPTRVLCTNSRPSRSGTPMWSVNSTGAAPVPPSLPSTTMKSGRMPVLSIALAMAMNSHGWPRQNLKPTGLPPDSSRRRARNSSSSTGVANSLCRAGEMQSSPSGTPRVAAISAVTLCLGRMPPWPGLAPWLSLTSIIFTCGSLACTAKRCGSKRPSAMRQPK